jgi:transcriptional regulator GlxA family with amidase domain
VRRALLLMEQNLTRPLPVTDIAAQLGLSVRQLERLCRSDLGAGPAALYRTLRLRYASWLIEHTDRSVTEIAIEAGFADCAHFSRRYKDIYGHPPTTQRLQPAAAERGDSAGGRVYG